MLHYHINLFSGSIRWEIELEGRIECSGAILDDFSQVLHHFIAFVLYHVILFHRSFMNILYLCDITSGCSWLLQRDNIFSWFFGWQHQLDFPNRWGGIRIPMHYYGAFFNLIVLWFNFYQASQTSFLKTVHIELLL